MSDQSQQFKAPYTQRSCDSDQWFLSYNMIFEKVPNIVRVFEPTVFQTKYAVLGFILVLIILDQNFSQNH